MKVNLFAVINELPFYTDKKWAILILIREHFVALKIVSYTYSLIPQDLAVDMS